MGPCQGTASLDARQRDGAGIQYAILIIGNFQRGRLPEIPLMKAHATHRQRMIDADNIRYHLVAVLKNRHFALIIPGRSVVPVGIGKGTKQNRQARAVANLLLRAFGDGKGLVAKAKLRPDQYTGKQKDEAQVHRQRSPRGKVLRFVAARQTASVSSSRQTV